MFKKKKNIAVFSLPFLAEELPKLLHTLLVPQWKETEFWASLNIKSIIGKPQKQNVDFDNSFLLTIDQTTAKCQICYTATKGSILIIIALKNVVQNTIAPDHK